MLNILLTFLKIYGIINTIKFGGIYMLDLNLCFDIYHANDKVGRVEIVNSKLIKNEVYTNKIIERLFPESTPLPNILSILKGRVICKERCDEDMLRSMGLKEYNVYDILRVTHGVDIDDFMWLKFDEDDKSLCWDDVRVR